MRDEANENFRRVAVALARRAKEPGQNTVLFAGANRREGTTTTVLNVARQLSLGCGLRPLIVELNPHQPAMARLLRLDPSRNVQSIAAGRLPVRECIQNGSFEVPAIPSGANGHSSELGGAGLKRILAEVAGEYDVVLIDAPAILEHADAIAAAGIVSGVVLVIEAGRTRYEVLDRVRRELEGAQANVIAAVLNKHKRFIPGWIYRIFVR